MTWVAFLMAVFMFAGLRRREIGGSSHLVIFLVTVLVLTAVYLQPSLAK